MSHFHLLHLKTNYDSLLVGLALELGIEKHINLGALL
jgi:hypothetical protein